MNNDVYIFGEFNKGYNQYPDDYTKKIFKTFYSNSESITQIGIHRDGNLVYYSYIRKLELSRYIGFCVVLNGIMLTRVNGLFSLFEKTIFELVSSGVLIHFDERGGIVTNVDKLYLNREKIEMISQSLSLGFNKLQKTAKALPPTNNSVSNDSIKIFSVDDNLNDIINSSHTYGYTFIYKSKDFNTPKLNNYKEVIESLYNEKNELTIQLNELNEEYQKTIKEKKQYRFVAILFFIVLGCLIVLLGLNKNLNQANSTITEQAESLKSKVSEIQSLEKEKKDLQNQINYKNGQILYLNNKNQVLEKQLYGF
jgi:uncharacterized protein (UPF0335 family)